MYHTNGPTIDHSQHLSAGRCKFGANLASRAFNRPGPHVADPDLLSLTYPIKLDPARTGHCADHPTTEKNTEQGRPCTLGVSARVVTDRHGVMIVEVKRRHL